MMITTIDKLQKPLLANEIDFRVQSVVNRQINGKWTVCAKMLAYKDARCDMRRLDDVFGFDGWQRLHKEYNGMLFGGVSIKSESGEWIEKWDVGEASFAHADKGLASDSFKRACFNLGIGRELYDYPEILVPLVFNENNYDSEYSEYQEKGRKKYKAGFALKPKEWFWFNQFNDDGDLTYLACKQVTGTNEKIRFSFGKYEKPENVA